MSRPTPAKTGDPAMTEGTAPGEAEPEPTCPNLLTPQQMGRLVVVMAHAPGSHPTAKREYVCVPSIRSGKAPLDGPLMPVEKPILLPQQ
jgi:hypothetical protein